jgi:hypothetical protein
MELKPQDLFVLYKQAADPERPWTYATLGADLGMSSSQVHRSVQRAISAGLAASTGRGEWHVLPDALIEFSVHGARYAFPPVLGAVKRGVPTSFGALPLSAEITSAPGEAPVWPHPDSRNQGCRCHSRGCDASAILRVGEPSTSLGLCEGCQQRRDLQMEAHRHRSVVRPDADRPRWASPTAGTRRPRGPRPV